MTTIDAQEIHAFEQVAGEWWNLDGPFKPLHQLNPVRMQYILEVCQRYGGQPPENLLKGCHILDVGCGGGLAAEPLAQLGAMVTAIDAGAEAIAVAQEHARSQNLNIDYRCGEASNLLQEANRFDVITALEIAEHVADVPAFIATLAALLKPGGLLVLSTLNRTVLSYMLGIIAAEYVLRWVPKGTHQWDKFLKPHELAGHLRNAGLSVQEVKGLTFNPLSLSWHLSSHIDVNYFMVARMSDVRCQMSEESSL
jgi:2-polyprenyl-6-hydroxyphenyl methylase/3-demethylubiquinone-9 3-methyltransferase